MAYNMERFQDLVYSEDSDIICVSRGSMKFYILNIQCSEKIAANGLAVMYLSQ